MTATTGGTSPATGATPRIRFDVFDRECAARGAEDETSRAELADIDRTTLWRWRHGKQTPSLEKATDIAARFGLSVEDLIERAA